MLRIALKRSIWNPVWGLALGGMLVCMLAGIVDDLRSTNGVLYLLEVSNAIGITPIAIPVLCALPSAWILSEEFQGNYYYQLIRKDKTSFVAAKCLACMLSGMAITLAATLVFILVGFGLTGRVGAGLELYEESPFWKPVWEQGTGVILAIKVFLLVIYSAMWPLASAVVATWTANRYVILAAPFLLFTALSYIGELMRMYWLCPALTLLQGVTMFWAGGGLPHAITYHAGAVCLLCLLFGARMKGKIANG